MKHFTTKTKLARAAMMLLGKQSRTADCRRSVTGRLLLLFLLLFTFLGGARAQTVTIGEGTSDQNSAPIANYYNYSIAEMLFTADEIGTTDANTILSLGFEGTGSCSKTYDITVYMKNVDAQSFTVSTDYIQVSENDVVFTGSIKPAAGWNTIDLDKPFAYDNTKSLLVVVNKTSNNYDSSTSIWKYTSTSSTYKMLYSQNDNNGYDATTLTSADLKYNRPNVQLTFGVPPTCFQPKNLQAMLTPGNGTVATLTWNRHPSGTEDAWVLQYGEDNTFATGTYTELTNGFTVSTANNVTTVTANLSGLTAEHTYYARVKPECDTDGTLWSEVVRFKPTNTLPITIGDGTSSGNNLPISTFYKYSLTQQIYTAAEIEAAGGTVGTINSVSFSYTNIGITFPGLKMYMLNTDKAAFESNTDMVAVSDADKVWEGTLSATQAGWLTIELDTPFEYDGGNIIVCMYNPTYNYTTSSDKFHYTSTTYYSSVYYYSDSSNPDLNNINTFSSNKTYNKYHNNIQFGILLSNTPKPRSLEFSNITSSGATMTWSAPATGTPTGYEYQYKLATDQWPATWTSNGTNLSVPVSGLTAGTDYVFRVRATYTEGESNPIETQFTTLDECAFPTGLAATPVPGNGAMATLSWTKGYDETEWVLQYGTDDTFATYTEKTDGFNTQDDPVITCDLTGLTAETTYYARVKAKCSATSSSSWSNVVEFVPSNFVDYTYNDGATSYYFYYPFYGSYTNSATNQSQFVIPAEELTEIAGGTIRSITYYATNTTTTTDWGGVIFDVYMAEVENSTFTDATFIDWGTLNNVYTGTVSLSNGMMTIAFDQNYTYNGGNLLIGFKTKTAGTETQSVSWRATYGSQYHVLYQYSSNSANRTYYFPKITFSYQPTPYKYPVIDEANCTYTTTSAHIAWTVTGAPPTGYQYQFKTISGEWPANWLSTTDTYADLSNLTHSTVYDFRVKALYDGGHESIVVNYRFATECDVITTFPVTYGFETTEGFPANASTSTTNLLGACWRNEATIQTGSNATRVWGTSTNYHHDGSQALILPDKGSSSSTETDCAKTMLVFPAMEFTAPSGYIVSFWINRMGTKDNPEGFKMYISDCDSIGPNAVELGHYSRNYGQPYPVAESGGGWYQYQTAPITTMTGTVYLIFEGHSYYGSATYVDDITIDVTPTCWQPQDLTASNVTNEAATITWTAGGSETSWQIEYATDANFTNPLSVTVNDEPTYTFHGLADGTNYYVHVQAVCGGTDGSSKYSDYLSFSTLQTAVNLPYATDFESGNDWLFVNGGLTNAWAYGTATSNGEGTHALYISNDGGTTNAYTGNSAAMVYATKTFNFNAGTYVFSYDWKAYGEGQYDYLRVALVPSSVTLNAGTNVPTGFTSSTLPTGWIALDGGEKLNLKSEWQSFKSNEIQVAAGTYMMVFAWKNNGITNNNPPAAIDNVSIETVTCPAPTGLACNPASITANSVELSWMENGEANAWQIELTYEEDEDDNTEIITADSTPFTLTNLNSDTEYTVRVRAYYDADHQSRWSEKVDFETASECQTPDGLAATATTTSADISWNGYGQANFNLRYSTYGENWTTIPENVTNPYTLTQLTPATTYYVQVQPTCADVETWSAQYSFTTDCDVITIAQDATYTYDFENPTPWICWTNIAGSNVRSSGSNNTTDGNYKLQFKGTTTGNIVAMPAFTPDINGLMLTFWTRPEGYTYNSCGTFSVGYMTDLADASTFVPVATYDRSDWTSDTYMEKKAVFTNAPAGAYIAFCHNALATNYYWYVDDVKVSITPTCWQPQNLAASNVTNEAATLTWERHPYGDETAWVLQYGTDDTFATCTEVNVDTNPIYEISGGLASETTYYARVKPTCDTEGDLWSEVESFTTLSNCTVPNGLSTTDITLNSAKLNWTGLQGNYNVRYRKVFTPKVDFDETYGFEDGTLQGWTSYDEDGDGQGWSNSSDYSHGGSKCVCAQYNSNTVPQNWFISPEIPLGGTISFYAMGSSSTGEKFQVYVSTTGTDIADFTPITDVIDATNDFEFYEYDLSAYSGNGYVAIKHTAEADQWYLYVDDITISCHISEEYGEWVNKSDVTSGLTIDGLEMNTMYEWQVQGICSECEGGATDWSAMDPFTTLPLLDITLVDDETDNASTIGANPGAYANVTLSGRTLYKDGYWNTLCLPFSLDADETAASPLAGANMMTLNTSASGFDDGTLTLNFAQANSIDAGKPFIVKWGKPADFVINSADDWDTFCDALKDNDTYNRFSGKTVVLGNNITVSSRAGSVGHEFMGTFDGQGHTLTVSYGTADSHFTEEYAVPFRYVDGCTIKNLRVDGTIISDNYRVAGVIGETGTTTSHITNCVSSATISGGRYTGGFSIGGNVEIENCAFNGKINGTERSGGFVGYSNSNLKITNCLFAPQSGSSISGGTFYYKGDADITPTNSYYTEAVGTAQGTDATSMNNAQLLNAFGSGWQEKDGKVVPVMSTDRIFEPVFTNVIIDATMNDVETSDGKATFKGTYDKIPFTSDNRSILFLGANNTLYWPESGASIGACRAYFHLNGLSAGDITAARLFFGDNEQTGIISIENGKLIIENAGDAWYTLDGRRLSGKPTRSGLYIHNGKSFVIK